MKEGVIASIVSGKGFGFIKVEGAEKDLFFHSSNCVGVSIDELHEGDKVTFTEGEGPKGKFADQVTRVA
jgi:cold shock protein